MVAKLQERIMALFDDLLPRAQSHCELCSNTNGLSLYDIPPVKKAGPDSALILCESCRSQAEGRAPLDPNHWRGLSESMWSEHTPVQVMAWRMLSQLQDEAWARDLLEQMYLDDSLL